MVRISDRIWNHVEKTDEVWKCRFCDHVFAKGIAAQIVKCHLAGVGGPGTKFCSGVPGHVKMEARREINEGEKKKRIIMSTSPSSSSNVTVEVSPKNDGERMIEQETILRSRDGVVERESDQEMIEAEFPAVMVKNGDSVCEICRHVYEQRTPAKRMQWHLADIGGSSDTICTSMPDDVKSAIFQEITESKRKGRKTVPGSSHTEDVPTMSIEDVTVQPLEAGWSGITKALEDLHNEADLGVRDEKMVEVEDASVKDSREEETTGVPPGDLRQPIEKDHEQSGGRQEKATEVLVKLQSENTTIEKLNLPVGKVVVLRLDMKEKGSRGKNKVFKMLVSFPGIESVALSAAKDEVTIKGDFDVVDIVSKLRKVCHSEIISIGPAKEAKKSVGPTKEEKKEAGMMVPEIDKTYTLESHAQLVKL